MRQNPVHTPDKQSSDGRSTPTANLIQLDPFAALSYPHRRLKLTVKCSDDDPVFLKHL